MAHTHIVNRFSGLSRNDKLNWLKQQGTVREFITSELLAHCEDNRMIHDRMGNGPEEISP
jgi:hypothetical protein